MKFEDLSFVEVYDAFFMQGSNLGNKINAAQKGAKITLVNDTYVAVYFKGKASFIPCAGVKSADWKEIPEALKTHWSLEKTTTQQEIKHAPPFVSHAQVVLPTPDPTPVPYPDFDPNDEDAAARHRAMVRAASANSNRAQPTTESSVVQSAREAAMGLKQHNAQVSNPTMPTQGQTGRGANVRGKTKAVNHAQLKTQVAAEMKDPNA